MSLQPHEYILCMHTYRSIVQYVKSHRNVPVSTQARFIITLVLSPINVALAGIVFWKMGFLLFDSLGANPVLHSEWCAYIGGHWDHAGEWT